MGSPITQLSKAKFGIGGRVFNSIRDQRERLCTSAEGLQNPFAKKNNLSEAKIEVSGVKLEILLNNFLNHTHVIIVDQGKIYFLCFEELET